LSVRIWSTSWTSTWPSASAMARRDHHPTHVSGE
jgi:hypothetical protein